MAVSSSRAWRNDLRRSLAIAMIGGPEILAFDDLGKADDRVERRLDLVDQLAERIRVGKQLRGRSRAAAARRGLAKRDPSIARETAVGGFERRHSADLPLAGDRTVPGDGQLGVAERRAHGEGANDLLVDLIAIILLRPRDRAPDHRPARRAVDPGDLSAGAAFPAEQMTGAGGLAVGAPASSDACPARAGAARSARRLRAGSAR